MPFVAVPIDLPPHVAEIRAGDVDADGREELIAVHRIPTPRRPDVVHLTVLSIGDDGQVRRRGSVDLGRTPAWWDVQGGLWLMDAEGIVQLDPFGGTRTRVVSQSTTLAGLGEGTPTAADFAHDLDGDGMADFVIWVGGKVMGFRADGGRWGSVRATGRSELNTHSVGGAPALVASVRQPALGVVDADGDGWQDLILPRNNRLQVHYTSAEGWKRGSARTVPFDLEPRPEDGTKTGTAHKRLDESWLVDASGDGRMDLLVHEWVLGSSWFGATAEISFCAGGDAGMAPCQVLRTESAALDVRRVDFDSDGDLDLVVPMMDFGLGNLGRALLSRTVRVQTGLFLMQDGRYEEAPRMLGGLSFPIEDPDAVQVGLEHDIDGDGVVDLVVAERDEGVSLMRGSIDGLDEDPLGTADVVLPRGSDTLFVHELTGGGGAELVIWGPGHPTATVLLWR